MKNIIRLKVLFLVGVFVFIGRDVYAQLWARIPAHPDKYINVVRAVFTILFIVFVYFIYKVIKEKEMNKDSKEGAESDESVQNFKKHYDNK